MSRAAVLAPRARADLLEATAYLASNNEEAARRLRHAVGEAARLLGAHPMLGRTRPQLAPTRYRFWALKRFPYLLVYEADSRPPRIARVLHMARDLEPLLADLEGSSDEN